MPTGLNITQRLRQSTEPGARAAEEAQERARQAEVAAAQPPTPQQQADAWLANLPANMNMFSPENVQATIAAENQRRDAGAAQAAQEAQVDATNQRYGSDLSWLDPSFQYNPSLLGQSAGSTAAADPNAINAQNAAMSQAQQMANTNLQFQSPAQQQALMSQWAGVQGGQGAPTFMGGGQQQQLMQSLLGVQAPQFESGAQQQSALNRLNSVGPAQFSGDADQRAVLNQALGMSTNTGPGSLTFDTSNRQGEQYGNLQGIIAGGGATAIEMADRARQRGDSEAWLRGQREADLADYAERGLTGSGMELLALSGDRQAAAGRNSLADLETAKALEERRLGAINSAAGLATNMRGQTVDEQGLLNNRSMTGLSAASSVANAMRGANIEEQQFLNTSAREQAVSAGNLAGNMREQTATEQIGLNNALRSQFTGAADIAGQMRTQGYNEQTYLDERTLNALEQQTRLSDSMRTQQANEQIGNRSALQNSLDTFASTSNNARQSSAQEAQYRATAADDFSVQNQRAINQASSENTAALQQGYQTMMNNRQQWEINNLNQQVNAATNLQSGDAAENTAGFTQGQQLGAADATWFNNLSQEQRNALMANFQGGQAGQAAANQAGNAANADIYGGVAGTAGMAAQAVASAYTGGAAGAAGSAAASQAPAAPATNLSQPTGGGGSNPYGVGVGGSSQPANYGVSVNGLTQAGGTNGNGATSAALPRNFDWDRLKQQTR